MQKSRGHKSWGVSSDPRRMDRPPWTVAKCGEQEVFCLWSCQE